VVAVDRRTPVLVGAAAIHQRLDDPTSALEATSLMAAAVHEAARDAGATGPALLARADRVMVPKGSWRYADAARLVAREVGRADARTVVADLGILQTTLFSHAARAIADGAADVVIIAGGEARWRGVRGGATGQPVVDTDDAGAQPDEFLAPDGMIISREEIDARLVTAASHYALIENARRAVEGQSVAEHATTVAALAERFNAVAVANPDAWNRAPMTAAHIAAPGPANKPQAFPYNKWHVSQWNVDQAAAFILCSWEAAQAAGIGHDHCVFPHAIAESNAMIPVSERAQITRSPGFALAGQRAFRAAGIAADDIAHVDLYSCFPIAVRVQAAELGLSLERPLTVTGGMTFAGGPLNNYALQSLAKMVGVLRADPTSVGLVTAISGMITKQGVSIWSARPPTRPAAVDDVSGEAAAATTRCRVRHGEAGPATVVTSTVLFEKGEPSRGVVVADRPTGERTIAVTFDTEVMASLTRDEWCGRTVHVADDQAFSP
jgi:acetyl-CoA C-acetyltransferase